MGHARTPPPVEIMDLSGEDPLASARGLGPPCTDPAIEEFRASVRSLLAGMAHHREWGLDRPESAALEAVVDLLRRLVHHGPKT